MKHFYVTVIRGKQIGWLFGPIADKAIAESFVPFIRKRACEIDPWCDFDAFGVSSIDMPDGKNVPSGKINY